MRAQKALQKPRDHKFQASHSWQAYFYCLLMFAFVVAPGLSAQTTSTITGTVRDKQGLPRRRR
jgi:hypothetical protein